MSQEIIKDVFGALRESYLSGFTNAFGILVESSETDEEVRSLTALMKGSAEEKAFEYEEKTRKLAAQSGITLKGLRALDKIPVLRAGFMTGYMDALNMVAEDAEHAGSLESPLTNQLSLAREIIGMAVEMFIGSVVPFEYFSASLVHDYKLGEKSGGMYKIV